MNQRLHLACCAALCLSVGCGESQEKEASSDLHALGQEFVPEVVCEDDAGEPPTEVDAGTPEVDAGEEDCATPPEEPPSPPDAGSDEDCATPPPSTEFPPDDAGAPPPPPVGPPPSVDCPQGGSTDGIAVEFQCTSIAVVSCKDLSNVVLGLSDGTHFKFDGLSGTRGEFTASAGLTIVSAWIKAGANASGEGPGYGQRFDALPGSCD